MRIGIADDAGLFRDGLALLLGRAGHEVVHSVGNGAALLAAVAADLPDVVLVDMRMPPTGENEGHEVTVALKARYPRLGVLVLTQAPSAAGALDLLREAGASGVGYYSKDSVRDVEHLLDALHRVAAGECAVDPSVPSSLIERSGHHEFLARLTAAETQVVALMAMGLSNGGIAKVSGRREGTVEVHIGNIYRKLHVDESTVDRRVLVVLAALAGHDPALGHLPVNT